MQRQLLAQPTRRNPFQLSIGPEAAFLGSEWRQARDEALVAAFGPPGLTFVVGEPGTGKSLLLLALVESLKKRNRSALHIRRGEVPPPERDRAILLVDEGDRLDESARERIVARASSFPCVVAGSPALPAQFGEVARDAAIIALAPMSPEEVGLFLADRLARAGLPPLLFTEEAVAALAGYSHGIPRLVAILASSAWLISGASPDTRITADHIIEAVTIRDGVPPDPIVPIAHAPYEAPPEPPAAELEPLTAEAADGPSPAEPPPEAVHHTVETVRAVADEIPIAAAAMPEITVPAGIPPRKRLSSLASSPFHMAALLTAFAVFTLATLLDRGVIDGLTTLWNGDTPLSLISKQTVATAPAVSSPVAPPPADAAPQQAVPPVPESRPPPMASAPVPSVPPTPQAPVELSSVQPSPAAIQAPAAPTHPVIHVVVRYRRGDGTASRQAASLAGRLREIGLQVDAPTPGSGRMTRPKLQYFFDEDRDAATAIAAYLGPRFGEEMGKPDPRDPVIQRGTVEIWVPGIQRPRRPPPPETEDGDDSGSVAPGQ